ncbi:MAG: phosphoglycerate dehydrogenase, partial [Thermoplasmata archaeon]|nr:phosphoglycerate dehydrogenase [Thermoplasmata archaeon]
TGSTYSVAELTMGHIISMARHLPRADASVKSGRWEKKKFMGTELHGKTLGFIGLGRIGWEVAVRCKAFGMNIMAYDPYLPKDRADELGGKMVGSPEEVYREADIITIHTPHTPETHHMVNEKAFDAMKNTAFILNCARGGIIDEDALYNALKDGKIAAAALDSFEQEPPRDSPLLALDNVFFTPHIGASTREAQEKAGTIVAEQVLDVLAGKRPDFVVNRQVYG